MGALPRLFLLLAALGLAASVRAELADTIQRVKPAVVAIGTYQKTRSPPFKFSGTGFVVGDGTLVATNAHVLPQLVDKDNLEQLKVAVRVAGREPELRDATAVATAPEHDLALLRIAGGRVAALTLRETAAVREGQSLAFTGFPIGSVLGFYPVTHRAMVSSITPIAIPSVSAKRLDARSIKRLGGEALPVLQLDATSYPGNSGSPLYDVETGEVVGILNMVFVKGTKESALTNPSGISYAIPVEHLGALLRSLP